MWYAILLAAMALAYWVVLELVVNTFKNASRKKPYIICFALVGFSIAVGFTARGQFMPRPNPAFGHLQLILCPSALLGLVFIDVPHPPLSGTVVLGLLIAVMNSALYAAIGGRIGAAMTKSKAVRS